MKFRCILPLLAFIVASNAPGLRATAGEAKPAPSPGAAVSKPSFVPFDFYPRHHDELGLNEAQVAEMQRLSNEIRASVESLEQERRERTKALQDAMAQDSIDPKTAMELFEAVLNVENELKALQFRHGITMRNLLTPEQLAKLQPIASKEKASGIAATSGVLDEKLQQLRSEIRKRSHGGEPSREVVARLEQIEQLARQGRVAEARTQIDQMLSDLRSEGGTVPAADSQRAASGAK